MDAIIDDANVARHEAHRNAVAHDLSAEWHRKVGVRLGLASTALSAIVGASLFSTVAASLGLDAKGTLAIPQTPWSLFLFYTVIALSLLAPVLNACLVYLNEPAQVARHTSSAADYYKQKVRLDSFIRKHQNVSLTGDTRDRADHQLRAISEALAKVRQGSIPLTDRALRDADERLTSVRPPPSSAQAR